MIEVGQLAPDFEVKDTSGKPFRLSSLRGSRVLLAFYPFAFSSTCTEELSCFRDDLSQFQGQGVEIIGISVDSHYSQRAYAEKLGISYRLLSDFSRTVSAAYGVLRAEGSSERAYFLIDQDGRITYKNVMDSLSKRLQNAELFDILSQHI